MPWAQIPGNNRKWELKWEDTVLATIYKKPNHPKIKTGADMFSLYVSSPKIYQKFSELSQTHLFETFEEATEAFDKLAEEKALPWAQAIVEYFLNKYDKEEIPVDSNV